MKARTRPLRIGLLGMAVAVAAAVALGVTAAGGAAWQWNWANVALIQAQGATEPAAMYEWSGAAIAGYTPRAHEPAASERLLDAYQLRWRGGGATGEDAAALAAYAAGHELAGDPPAAACAPVTAGTLEAEEFTGVAPDTLSVPTWIDERAAVLLFTTQPISQTVCLDAAGAYTLGVAAANSTPGPIEFRVDWDGWPAGVLRYDKGDGSLSLAELRIVAPAGRHALGITFANDFVDPAAGIDRNAVVDAVTIARESVLDERTE